MSPADGNFGGLPSKIGHTGATQRHHIRLRTPLTVIIGNQHLVARDWSVAGFALQGVAEFLDCGAIVPVRVRFDVRGMALEAGFEAEVCRVDPAKGTLAARFTNVTPQQSAILRTLASAALSGDILDTDDLTALAVRPTPMAARTNSIATPPGLGMQIRRVAVLLCLWGISLGLIAILLINGFNRAFVVTGNGVLDSPEAVVVRAPEAATVLSLPSQIGGAVAAGQALATVQIASAAIIALASPCACVVSEVHQPVGAYVGRGSALLTLAPQTGRLVVSVPMALASAQRLARGDKASITLFSGNAPIIARVDTIGLPGFSGALALGGTAGALTGPNALVTLKLEAPLPMRLSGQPVIVRINTARIGF